MNRIILISIFSFMFCLFCLNAFVASAEEFYNKKAEGWHWYEDRKKLTKEQETDQQPPHQYQSVASLRAEAEEKLNIAISNPTNENVKSYMLIQKQILDQSNLFSQVWKRIVYTNPDLDATVKRPSSQYGSQAFYDLENKHKKEKLDKIAREYGLFYFYKESCAFCKKFSPLVQSFAKKYKFSLLPVTMDGRFSEDMPGSKIDNGISQTLGITQVPALIAVNTATGKTIPLSHGLISLDEIEERAFFLTKDQEEDDVKQ